MKALSNRAAMAVVVGFAAGLALFVVLPPLLDPAPGPDEIAAGLAGNPDIRQTIAALRSDYPADYRALLERLAARAEQGGDQSELDREAADFMQRFMAARSGSIASAPDSALRDLARAYADLIGILRDRDPELCASFLAGGVPEGARPPRVVMVRLDRISALRIQAARAGEVAAPRPRAATAPGARRAWFERMAELDAPAVAALSAGGFERSPAQLRCRAGFVLYQAASELPPAQSPGIVAGLLAGAAPAGPGR